MSESRLDLNVQLGPFNRLSLLKDIATIISDECSFLFVYLNPSEKPSLSFGRKQGINFIPRTVEDIKKFVSIFTECFPNCYNANIGKFLLYIDEKYSFDSLYSNINQFI